MCSDLILLRVRRLSGHYNSDSFPPTLELGKADGFIMDKNEIFAKITEVMRDVLDNDSIEAAPEMTAKDVEDWDSFSHIRIVLGVEQAFGVKFATPEIAQFENVGQLADLVAEKISNQ